MGVKGAIQAGIRGMHATFLKGPLPDHASLYFHSLERSQYGAFKEMLMFFEDHGYSFVTAGEHGKSLQKTVFISFDDNYRCWWQALALFDELGVKVSCYVNTMPFRDLASSAEINDYFDRIEHHGQRETLSTTELLEIARAGHVIGAHTHSHLRLTSLPHQTAEHEIRRGKSELEAILGEEVRHFSYPYGMRRDFNEPLRRYCRNLGFQTVANAIPAMQRAVFDPFAIQRSVWRLERTLAFNLDNLCIDGRWFHALTGRSAVG